MKKTTIFKIALSFALALFMSSLYGQYTVDDPDNDYENYTTAQDAGDKEKIEGGDGISYITVGANIPVVVMPDAAFLSGNYDFNTEAATNLTSTWTWACFTDWPFSSADANYSNTLGSALADGSRPANDATVGRTYNYKDAGIGPLDDNLNLISFSTAGQRYLTVIETSDALYGGCEGDTTSMVFTAFPRPYLFFENADDGNYELGDAVCGGYPANLVIYLEGVPHTDGFDFTISVNIDNVDPSDTWIADVHDHANMSAYVADGNSYVAADLNIDLDDADDDNTETTGTETLTWATGGGGAYNDATGANGEYTLTHNFSFTVANNAITRYQWTLVNVNDDVARKSDYWDGSGAYTDYAYNAGASQAADPVATLTFYVKPTPTTGNIYHIPN